MKKESETARKDRSEEEQRNKARLEGGFFITETGDAAECLRAGGDELVEREAVTMHGTKGRCCMTSRSK